MADIARAIDRDLRALRTANTPSLRAVRRRYSKELRDASARAVRELIFDLQERYGRRFIACELISYHPEALASLRATHLRRLGRGMQSWSDVDTFCCLVAGQVWRERQVPDSLIHGWARSRDRWWRRSALVATVPLNTRARGGRGDSRRTQAVCRLLLDDRDDMIEKALSWALRELIAWDADGVDAFLERYDDRIAARVRREVRNKLATGLKNPGRGGTHA